MVESFPRLQVGHLSTPAVLTSGSGTQLTLLGGQPGDRKDFKVSISPRQKAGLQEALLVHWTQVEGLLRAKAPGGGNEGCSLEAEGLPGGGGAGRGLFPGRAELGSGWKGLAGRGLEGSGQESLCKSYKWRGQEP